MIESEARELLWETAVLWGVACRTSEEVVEVACDALVAGLDSQSLRELAGVPYAHANVEVPDLLERAMDELGMESFERGSDTGKLAALRAMARHCVRGTMAPSQLTGWAHLVLGHGSQIPAVEAIVSLEDSYDLAKITRSVDPSDVDEQVLEACRRLAEG